MGEPRGRGRLAGRGQALLGYLLTSGPAEMRDLDAADAWYEKSAAAGCPQGHLGVALAQLRNALDAEGPQKPRPVWRRPRRAVWARHSICSA